MSEENVEHVRRVIDLLNRGDVDGALRLGAEDLVMDMSNSMGPDQGIYRGKAEVRELWASLHEGGDRLRWEPEEFIDVDEERLIVVTRARMQGPASGVEVEAMSAALWTIRDGKGRSVKLYQSKADALEAAGLSE